MERPDLELVKPSRNETIAVVGSGIAGCLTAYELAHEGYDVTVIEERENVLSGTSAHAVQVHLGGLYSGSLETAKECLDAAIELKQVLPASLNKRKASFLVAEESDLTMDKYVDFYEDLTDHYASLPSKDQVFGPPEDFFRVLRPEEYVFAKNVAGGIATQEPGLDMTGARRVLTHKLGQLGVKIITSTSAIGAEANNDQFTLMLKSGNTTKYERFDQVVNASGYKARLLDDMLGDTTQYHLFLKAWNFVKASDGQQPLPPFVVVRGGYIHHSPISDGTLSCLLAPKDGGSYLASMSYDRDNPSLPPEWTDILQHGVPDKREHYRRILDYAGDRFLKDPKFEPIDVIAGVAVSYSATLQDRTGRGVREVVPGWHTAVPTKATTALPLARATAAAVMAHSGNKAHHTTPGTLAA